MVKRDSTFAKQCEKTQFPFHFRASFLKELGFTEKPNVTGLSISERDACKKETNKRSVVRPIINLQIFSGVMGQKVV